MSIGIAWGNVERVGPGMYRLDFKSSIYNIRAVTGVEKLVYEVLYVLFTTMGTVINQPNIGCWLTTYLGSLIADTSGNMDQAREAFTLEIIRTQDQIKQRHIGIEIPAEEKLGSIVVDEIVVNPTTYDAEIRIVIVNALGQTAMVSIPQVLQAA